jgi:uncharacterized protein (DUF1778 family)
MRVAAPVSPKRQLVVLSAQEAAAKVLQEHEALRLTRAEQTAFVKSLLAPPAPSAALRQAASAYKKRRARPA